MQVQHLGIALRFVFAILLGSGLSVPVQAQTYISLAGGDSLTLPGNLTINQPGRGNAAVFEGVRWSSRAFEVPIYWTAKIGHDFANSRWGIELDYTHMKVYARVNDRRPVTGVWNGQPIATTARLGDRVQMFQISDGVNIYSLQGTYRFPGYRWQPYIGGGPAYFILHPENRVDGVKNSEEFESGGWGIVLSGGVRYRINRRWGAFGEAKYTRGVAHVTIGDEGNARTDLRTLHLALGLRLSF